MASNESFKQAIKAYLDKRAEEDSLFAPKYANEKKSIDECCSYIMGEARKRGNAVAISDEEVYGMAVSLLFSFRGESVGFLTIG